MAAADSSDCDLMRSVYLDWRQALLPAAAAWSIERVCARGRVDLSTETHLLSGKRAARRYLELLTRACAEQAWDFDPPEVLVPSQWEALHRQASHRHPTALELECAFRSALAVVPHGLAERLQLRPESTEALARELAQLCAELAGERCDLRRLAARSELTALLPERERGRLAALAELEGLAAAVLLRAERDWPADARWQSTAGPLVLIGLVELPPLLRQRLEAVDDDAVALIHAPADWADRFDHYGRPLLRQWLRELDLLDRLDLRVASDPSQEATQVLLHLAELGELPVDEITVGLLDSQVERPLRTQLLAQGCELHVADGFEARRHPLWLALAQVGRLLRERSFTALAALLRVPLVESRLAERRPGTSAALARLDAYCSRHLPHGLAELPAELGADADIGDTLRWCAELSETLSGGERALGNWSAPLRTLIAQLCGAERYEASHPAGRRSLELLQATAQQLEVFERLPAALQVRVDAAGAIDLLLQELPQRLSELPKPEALEAVGWLELAADDAPHLLIVGANEGSLPRAPQHDPVLSDSLREQLGLPCEAAREARDLCLLLRMTQSRESCALFLARSDLAGKPLLPSRLLLRGSRDALPSRLNQLLQARARVGIVSTASDDPRIARPPQLQARPISRLSITAFKDWLRCPYRFHLSRVLRLAPSEPEARELDPSAVGKLLHAVFDDFARSAAQLETEPEMRAWLDERLAERARAGFGTQPQPAVRVQLELLRQRLRAFARLQAERTAEGWEIWQSELPLSRAVEVDGEVIELVGRIDRIDRHGDGRVQILDIKTHNQALDPRKSHGPDRAGAWRDLQLPLYLRLFDASSTTTDAPAAGYLQLPADSRQAGIQLAHWEPEELEQAWECAESVIRGIRSGNGLDAPRPPEFGAFDPYALICRSEVFEDATE